jgi:uncharacterized membrane protein YfcA
MDNRLTEDERKLLTKLYKSHEKIHYNYITVGFLGCISLLGVVLGIKLQSKDGFLMAIYFGTISIMIAIHTISENKIVKIIRKLQRHDNKDNV